MCKKNRESGDRLLLHYEHARELWSLVFCLFRVQWIFTEFLIYWHAEKGVLLNMARLIFGILFVCVLCGLFGGSIIKCLKVWKGPQQS